MHKITLELTRDEAVAVRFLLGGAPHNWSMTPLARVFAQEALAKLDAAMAPPPAVEEQPEEEPETAPAA